MSSRVWQILSPNALKRLRAIQKNLYGIDLELRGDDDRPVKATFPSLQEIERTIKQKPHHLRKVA